MDARERIGPISGGRVLDVATGSGGFIHFLLEGLRELGLVSLVFCSYGSYNDFERKPAIDRCEEHEQFEKIDAAFRAGDLAALRAAVDDPESVPNGPMPVTIGSCLEYAIYHSPLAFIRELLEIGADPNFDDGSGFPPLIAALSAGRAKPGSTARTDVLDLLGILLSSGADSNQRGINDYTPLHMAVGERNLQALKLLLEAGADPLLRTRIDDYETPREMAEAAGLIEYAAVLRECEARS